jgi:hypothetical protein
MKPTALDLQAAKRTPAVWNGSFPWLGEVGTTDDIIALPP